MGKVLPFEKPQRHLSSEPTVIPATPRTAYEEQVQQTIVREILEDPRHSARHADAATSTRLAKIFGVHLPD